MSRRLTGVSGGVFTVDGDISVSSETTLKTDGSSGDDVRRSLAQAAVIITALDATTDADLDGIETDLTIDLGANNVALAADATLDVCDWQDSDAYRHGGYRLRA